MLNKMDGDKRYDIFVAGPAEDVEAMEIADMLRRRNYNVIFPGESLDASKVDDAVLAAISKCKDFIVVLSNGGIQALKAGNNPLSMELRRAMQRMRNVIPVSVNSTGTGFAQLGIMPGLPEETYEFAALSAVDAATLTSRLTSRIQWNRKLTVLSVLAATAAVVIGALLLCSVFSRFPRNASERESALQLFAAIESSVSAYATGGDAPDNAIRGLSSAEAVQLVHSLEGSGVDLVALAGILAAPEIRRRVGLAGGKEALEDNVAKVLSAVHGEEAEACMNRVKKLLGGMK